MWYNILQVIRGVFIVIGAIALILGAFVLVGNLIIQML